MPNNNGGYLKLNCVVDACVQRRSRAQVWGREAKQRREHVSHDIEDLVHHEVSKGCYIEGLIHSLIPCDPASGVTSYRLWCGPSLYSTTLAKCTCTVRLVIFTLETPRVLLF